MRTRAKFHITGVELHPGKDAGGTVKLSAVARGDRNATWAAASPSGVLTMTINNPLALQQFIDMVEASREHGRYPEVFLDFTQATDGYPGDGHTFRASEGKPGTCYDPSYCGECGMPKESSYGADKTPSHPNG